MYLQHEEMLYDDQKKRLQMNDKYDKAMKELSEELYRRKDDRHMRSENNIAVRKKIQEAIEEYKKEEGIYENEMKTLQAEVDKDQNKIKWEMEHGETGKKVALQESLKA